MPEGDTLLRTAATLHRWLAGRTVTGATGPAAPMVGRTVEGVEANGKHLLVRFDSGHALHTHMRMTGSWHVYTVGERWRRPPSQAGVTVSCGDRIAVCFNAPVVELLVPGGEQAHPALRDLGPDILAEPLDVDEIRRRARTRPPGLALGELLLDQRVVAGIGNIWRSEALFAERLHPWTPQSAVTDDQLGALVSAAARLMGQSSVGPFAGRPQSRVYRRSGRPCLRCRSLVRSRRQGEQARTAYWCPTCQPQPGDVHLPATGRA